MDNARSASLPATHKLLKQALSVRDQVDAIIAANEGDHEALLEQLGQADGLAEYISRLQLCAEEKREAANVITTARLKLIAAIGRALPREVGGRGKKSNMACEGLHANTLARYRKVADAIESLDDYIAEIAKDEADASLNGFIKFTHHPEKRESSFDDVNAESESGIVTSLDEVYGHKFGTIYADPPWKYGNQGTRAATDNHYDTMTVDSLCELAIAELAADDSHLHLWTTNAFLFDARRVMQAWGFEYKSCFVWVKPQMGIGNYWRVSHEFLLLGVRGNAKSFAEHGHMSWKSYDRTKHSSKPEEVRHIIERVSPSPRLELFGRKPVEDWVVFGNQIDKRLISA